ncbi:hypothetical protein CHH78_05525 [Shouchella clausii]|uniref:restriction endonuclease subunit S n=1 Tax=Shouchella clausii TaxID=79880 RepID=UPI000BA79822|nr:restriction endonuclease subunit S [Shouchella clausii]MBU8594622.1 restriction endonuclease subunit S [Shouchella clausii]PAD11081.1 hypothetical protein CHH76_00580 [Shouchella clausii]PAE85633.1 hypothetical protein CHH78_05525 [Shouchella clausii]PAF06138.1 hypothetical protein CHH66_05675 [Shouchella clausii]
MAKKKKTMEELLEEALVPEEEQPYEVPGNWVWVSFGSVAKLYNGYAFKSSDYMNEGIPIIRISDISNGKITTSKATKVPKELYNEKFLIKKGDLLIAMSGATTGKTGIFETDDIALQNQRVGNIKEISEKTLDQVYKNYFVFNKSDEILSKAHGGAQPNISSKLIEGLYFPLPPLNEQKRIADKVERLLNKIDEARRLIEEAKESFELRRAAILDKAFRGELTRSGLLEEKNDNKNGCFPLPTNWEWKELKDVADFKNGYAFKSKDFVKEGIQLIRMGNLYGNELLLDRNPVYLPPSINDKILEKYTVSDGDILLTLTGTKYKRDYGYAVHLNNIKKPLLLNQRILSLKPKNNADYIFYYLQSNIFRDKFFSFETGGVNQGNVGSKAVESILVPIAPESEAREIEFKIKKLFSKEYQIKNLLSIENNIYNLKQSILTKAFKGQLGTNDPTEENAIELLKEVLQEKL